MQYLKILIDILNYPTMNEWIQLKSTLVSTFNNRYLCSTCLERYPTQPERLEKERKVKGCYNEYSEPIHNFEGIEYMTCVGNFYSDSAASWIEFYNHYEKGIMPFKGNYFDQPAKAIQVLRTIQVYKLNWDAERARQRSAKQAMRIK